MDCSLPGSFVHGIFQARILDWVAISFSRGSCISGIEPLSPALQKDSLPLSHLGMEKEMATHSSILAWRIPWTEEFGGLQSTGRKESDTTEQLHFTHFHLGNPPGWARSSFEASRKFALKKETWGGSQPLCTKPAFRESPLHPTPHTRPCGKMSPVWRAVGGVSLGEDVRTGGWAKMTG